MLRYTYRNITTHSVSVNERLELVTSVEYLRIKVLYCRKKMVIKHKVEGYDNFCEFMKNLKTDGEYVHVYFSGSKLPSGISWCEDCVRGEL